MEEVTSSWAGAACGSKSAAASSPHSAGGPTALSSLYHNMSRTPWILYLVCAAGAGFKSVATPFGLEAATHAS